MRWLTRRQCVEATGEDDGRCGRDGRCVAVMGVLEAVGGGDEQR